MSITSDKTRERKEVHTERMVAGRENIKEIELIPVSGLFQKIHKLSGRHNLKVVFKRQDLQIRIAGDKKTCSGIHGTKDEFVIRSVS